jgi:hypothetical protein
MTDCLNLAMRRVAARDTVEFDFLQVCQRVGDCEHVNTDS